MLGLSNCIKRLLAHQSREEGGSSSWSLADKIKSAEALLNILRLTGKIYSVLCIQYSHIQCDTDSNLLQGFAWSSVETAVNEASDSLSSLRQLARSYPVASYAVCDPHTKKQRTLPMPKTYFPSLSPTFRLLAAWRIWPTLILIHLLPYQPRQTSRFQTLRILRMTRTVCPCSAQYLCWVSTF